MTDPAPVKPSAAAAAPSDCAATTLAPFIAQQELPSFGLVLQELLRVTASPVSSGHQVAETILHDPGLTARVLRAANAAYLGVTRVATVSRAVAVLGINGIRALSVSALVFETLGEAPTRFRPRVQRALARALHTAVQARDIETRLSHDRERAEQCATDAMLSAVGELAFWCFGGPCADRLERALAQTASPSQAEVAVLGVTLRGFGQLLLQSWGLASGEASARALQLAERLAAATEAGWDSDAARRAVAAIAAEFDADAGDTRRCLEHNADTARALAVALGSPEVATIIPQPPAEPAAASAQAPAPTAPPAASGVAWRDVARIMTEMTTLASSRAELPLLFDACLEGLHRAVGVDRGVLCLYTPQRDRLLARMAVGVGLGDWRRQWQLPATPALVAALAAGAIHAYDEAAPMPAALAACSQARAGLLAALAVEGKVIGFIYADNHRSARRLDDEAREAFRAFALQTDVVIRALPKAPPEAGP